HFAYYFAAVAVAYPAQLRKRYTTAGLIEFYALRVAECIVLTAFFDAGECSTLLEEFRRGRHCVFLMHVHLGFVAKYRRKIFDPDAIEKLHSYFASVCADFDVELVEMDGEIDHMHLLINYPPKLAVSSLVNSLKGVSSRLLRRDRPDIAQRYYY
ncbi:REP element-mobilizing transposase RayT, partial [Scandinavium goeteborgense]